MRSIVKVSQGSKIKKGNIVLVSIVNKRIDIFSFSVSEFMELFMKELIFYVGSRLINLCSYSSFNSSIIFYVVKIF